MFKESPPPGSPNFPAFLNSLWYFRFAFFPFFVHFFNMFLVVYSKFHTWCMAASGKYRPARRRRHRNATKKKNDLQASRLIDFLIWSRGMRWLHCDRVLQRAQDRTQRGDSRILCKLDPPRIEWHALITSFPSRATHSSRFRFIRIVS